MKRNIDLHIWRILPILLISSILSIAGCRDASSVSSRLDAADSLMELRPDSSLIILDSIQPSDLNERNLKARYALLKSMALDKNYVDTTTFDILQPAIDYYLEKGTTDEKLRTYYYQGRIYQNMNEQDRALRSFMRGLDIADACKDSLTIARMLVAQAAVYVGFYDFNASSECYLRAADIYRSKHNKPYEFDCLISALDGMNILSDKERADSLIKVLNGFGPMDEQQKLLLHTLKVTYVQIFGSKQELKQIIEDSQDSINYNVNGILNLAMAYGKLGDNDKAIRQLDYLDEVKVKYDTLKYLSIKYPILENLGRYKEALAVYNDFVDRFETVNSAKFDLNIRTMEEKHQMELQAEREAVEHAKTRWKLIGGICVLVTICIIIILFANHIRIQKNLVLHEARAAELENDKLKAENDLTQQRALNAELENDKLKTKNELTQQRALNAEIENDKLALENRNLQLEYHNKALEAENLAHRVETLEGESENLKELLQSQKEMPAEVRKAIQTRIEMLNTYLASQISDHREFEKAYDVWVSELTADTEEFMNSNRLAFQASHPAFIKYFEDHGLTTAEINYVCLYAIGLRGKDVGSYMKKRSHVNISSAIRSKLGIDRHETNIGIYVRKLLRDL
ncbi:MAG: hypothetical protein HDR47_05300 [Bacteroides sp.]|nr:hypothetical protein [Bacteroides sp.]